MLAYASLYVYRVSILNQWFHSAYLNQVDGLNSIVIDQVKSKFQSFELF